MDHGGGGGRKKGGKRTLSTKFHSLFNHSVPNFSTKWKMFHESTHFFKKEKKTLDKDFIIKVSKKKKKLKVFYLGKIAYSLGTL